MVSYAWGNHTNGQIPASAMGTALGVYLKAEAASALVAMAAAFKKKFGKDLSVTEGYRPLGARGDYAAGRANTQWYYYERRQANPSAPSAAYPGGSIHGWASAVDINLNGMTAEQIEWLHTVGREYGFNWDTTGKPSDEPWHLDFNLSVTAALLEIEELKEAIVAITAVGAIENLETKNIAIFGDVKKGWVEVPPDGRTRYNALRSVLNELSKEAGGDPVLPEIPHGVDAVGWENTQHFYKED